VSVRNTRRDYGHYLSSLDHAGRVWDVYVEPEDDPSARNYFRGRLVFVPADPGPDEYGFRTIPVLIETSPDRLLERARTLEAHLLAGFLRSMLP
jgi:hypothetical protein